MTRKDGNPVMDSKINVLALALLEQIGILWCCSISVINFNAKGFPRQSRNDHVNEPQACCLIHFIMSQ